MNATERIKRVVLVLLDLALNRFGGEAFFNKINVHGFVHK